MAIDPVSTRARRELGHDEIAAILGSEILAGQHAPGSLMPSLDELNERFGASRVLMREVTKTLVAKGLVTAKSGVGTRVLPSEYWNWFDPDVLAWRVRIGLDEAFLRHLVQMRRAVEPVAAAIAAEARTEHHLAQMRAALDAMIRAGSDRHAFSEADLDFHVAVAAASGNPLFRSFASVVATALSAYFSLSTPAQDEAIARNIARHRAIADAIEAGDAQAAARAMENVIVAGLVRVAKEPA